MPQNHPIKLFTSWYQEATEKLGEEHASTMCLATADKNGKPSSRMVLLKKFDEDGFVFFTNMNSRKGRELISNPNAALCFYWQYAERQVRIEGTIGKVSDEAADEYFNSRHPKSRVGAIVSKQSEKLEDYPAFVAEVGRLEKAFQGNDIPRPPHWSGFLIRPQMLEFWQGDKNRLHHRLVYEKAGDSWQTFTLYP